jgi:integrase
LILRDWLTIASLLLMGGKRLHFQASEMKANRSHTLDLTEEVMAIIQRNISKDSNYIFKGYGGRSKLGDFKKAWIKVRALSGVKCRWHDLRHTCASELHESGVTDLDLMNIMAWSDIRTALRYTHLSEGKQLANLQKREQFVHQSVHQEYSQ